MAPVLRSVVRLLREDTGERGDRFAGQGAGVAEKKIYQHVCVCKAQIARGTCSARRKIECNGYSGQKGRGDVTGDLDGRERFASAGLGLSETSSDVSRLPERVLGEVGGGEEESSRAVRG